MKRWHFWLGVLISACFIFIALSRVDDWGAFGTSLSRANYLYLFPILASTMLIMFFRAVRWRYILNQTGHARLADVFGATLVCYMGNNVFPLRAGEFMRVFLIGKRTPDISYGEALATVVVERLFDFLVMLLFLAAVLITVPFPEKYRELQGLVHGFGAATLIGAAALFAFLVLLFLYTEKMIPLIARALFFLPAKLSDAILAATRKFAAGLAVMGRPRALFVILAMGVFIWFINLLPIWLTGLAFELELDVAQSMFLTVVGAAAASIPAAPGFIGTYHSFIQEGLIFLTSGKVTAELALSYAIVLHASYYFLMILAGAVAAWVQGYSLTRLKEAARETGDEAGPETGGHLNARG